MEMAREQIGKEYNFITLIKFATPTIIMLVFMSVYTIIDGIFLARFVGASALSAVNIFLPVYALIFAIGLMLATGGSAVLAKKMGESKSQQARENFTFIVICGSAIGIIIMIFGLVFIKPLLTMLGAGASEELFSYTHKYAMILLLVSPLIILQDLFLQFFITIGKPRIGLFLTILGGLTNIVLDYVFIVLLQMGTVGAAIGTGIGIAVPAIFGLAYFTFNKRNSLYFVTFKADRKVLLLTSLNGASEMVSNLSLAVVTFAFNILMIKHLGVDGVAAVTILLYAQYIIISIFAGYSMGVAPIISYNFGSKNNNQLKRIFKYSLLLIALVSIAVYGLSIIAGSSLIQFMAPQGGSVYRIAIDGFKIFSISFMFMGFNIFTSALFTAFSNGKISATVSLMRTLVFVLIGLLILPLMMGVDGIWLAVPFAEFLSLLVCIYFLMRYKKIYNYS
ncbi:MATE family efflux transporter [Ornithinibacillus salinisoli]|uniref:MATE family efflux transporter n=2 Tax=Ornithinibacillus salinisoli TaxID=1848459 RepID=A0ABW4VZL5_9BACI